MKYFTTLMIALFAIGMPLQSEEAVTTEEATTVEMTTEETNTESTSETIPEEDFSVINIFEEDINDLIEEVIALLEQEEEVPNVFDVQVASKGNRIFINMESIEEQSVAGTLEIKEAHIILPAGDEPGLIDLRMGVAGDFAAQVVGYQEGQVELRKDTSKGLQDKFLQFPLGDYTLMINEQHYGTLIIEKKDAYLVSEES